MANHEYPYTLYSECDPCGFFGACRRAGVKLAVVGDSLQLLDKCNFVLSQVKINQATIALQDEHDHNIDDYVYNVIIRNNKLVIVDGNGNETELEIPEALHANTATTADTATLANTATEATHALSADNATRATLATTATEATHAATADYATASGSAVSAQNAAQATHADNADLATQATSAQTATTAQNANFATKAQSDANGNVITSTYVANVTVDANTGEIKFYAKNGALITTVTPVAQVAIEDQYGNDIGDYVKSVVVSDQADYILVEHGDGTSDTYYVNYSNKAWKDTAGNIIKNVYAKTFAIVYDSQTNEPWLVWYNGEGSEIGRVQIVAQSAQTAVGDADGDDIRHTYGTALNTGGRYIRLYSKDGTLLSSVIAPYATEADTANAATYADQADYATAADSATKALQDGDGDVITTTYGASFDIGDIMGAPSLALTDKNGNILAEIIVPYAEQAVKDSDNNIITSTYVSTIAVTRGTYGVVTQIDFNAPDGTTILSLDNIKVNEAVKAAQDTYGNNFRNNYAAKLEISGTNVLLKSIAGDTLSTITVPYATSAGSAIAAGSATNATNDASGNNIETNYGASLEVDNTANLILKSKDGTVLTTLASPLHLKVDEAVEALRATTDSDNNVIATTYIASLAYANGVLTAYDSRGNVLQTLNIP